MDVTLLLKASLVLSAALLAAAFLRNASALARHRYWSVVFGAILMLPLLALALPAFMVPMPVGWEAVAPVPVSEARDRILTRHEPVSAGTLSSNDRPLPARAEQQDSARRDRSELSVRTALLAAWAIGTGLALAALLLSLLRVQRLLGDAEDVDDPSWRAAATAIGGRLGIRRSVRLLLSEHVTTPMAGGMWRLRVFLPLSSRTWTPEHRDVVLAHEIAHLASRDPLRHLLTRLAIALYWFHPLAWMAARQAGVAREEACDAAVLALGTRPSVYARVLLDLADSIQAAPPRLLATLPMIQRSRLEKRLMVILTDTRPATRRVAAIPLLLVGLFTLAVAAAQPELPSITPNAVQASVVPATALAASAAARAGTHAPAIAGVPTAGIQTSPAGDCWRAGHDGSFSGSMSMTEVGGRTVIHEQVGTRGTDRVIQKTFGDLRLCLVAEGVGDSGKPGLPSQWLGMATRFLMEARPDSPQGSNVLQLEGERQAGGGQRITWRVGGRERPFDSAGEQWRNRMLAVFDTTWELSALRGEVSARRGEISSIRGEESSLRGEISSFRGQVSSMRGRISSLHGEESSLRGEISSIHGHLSSLRGAISSERGAISSLNAGRYGANDAERASISAVISRHEAEIARLEREIRAYDADAKIAAVEREIASLDTARRVAAIEAEIRAFDLDGKVATIERRIAALDVQGKVAAIERQIGALDADRRGRQLEDRRDAELKQLQAAMAAVR
jgi:beta-lactamase regulating signal transducer with metallopeptidase domain/predicted  nucleic acid-binding Zn-ribbon protein